MDNFASVAEVVRFFDQIPESLSVAIVCNTKSASAREFKHNHPFDPATEYLSDAELDQVIAMFAECCHKLVTFTHEFDFFHYAMSLCDKEKQNIIVYNSAQSGTGAGRKSLIPAFCNLERMTCTGSDPYVVGLCRHKYHVNMILKSANLPIPQAWLFSQNWLFGQCPSNGEKVIMKPIYESASIGIDGNSVFCYEKDKDIKIKEKSNIMKQPIIVQQFIPGHEVELPLLRIGETILPFLPVELSLLDKNHEMSDEILDYEHIYFDRYQFSDFTKSPTFSPNIFEVAKSAVKVLGIYGLCRVDFRINKFGEMFITDVSTNPHFIKHSSVNYAARTMGFSDSDIVKCILSAALLRLGGN